MAGRLGAAGWLGLASALIGGCSAPQDRIQQHERQLRSLGATTAVVSDAWLSGRVSAAYAVTALEQTPALVERERAALGTDAELLRDAAGGQLSQAAEQLARQLAAVIGDVERADVAAVRRQLAGMSRATAERP
jgi:hypothetical protein